MSGPRPSRASETAGEPAGDPEVWLVDGYNVLHAGILRGRDRRGWWKAEAQARAVERIARFEGEGEIWIAFDRREQSPGDGERGAEPPEPAAPPRIHVAFAPSADDWIARRVRAARTPDRVAVVTADRRLAGRARHHGARVVSPSAFLARCPAPPAREEAGECDAIPDGPPGKPQ